MPTVERSIEEIYEETEETEAKPIRKMYRLVVTPFVIHTHTTLYPGSSRNS